MRPAVVPQQRVNHPPCRTATFRVVAVGAILLIAAAARAQTPPATEPGNKLPHIHVDVKAKQVRVDCEALNVDIPLEFFCVTSGGNEHESILRTPARPSQIHFALLMLGLQPGEPVRYSEAAKRWFPPHGPPLRVSVEYQKDGRTVHLPATQLMRSLRTKQPMPPMTWIFAGSRVLEDGTYGADPTGYVVSIVNFELTLIDIPELASSANETLEWERNPDTVPPTGTPVTMIIEPAGQVEAPPSISTQLPDGTNRAGDADTSANVPNAVQSPSGGQTTVLKISADDKADLDGAPVDARQLTQQLQKLKSAGPVNVRLAVAAGADAAYVKTVTDAVAAAGLSATIVDTTNLQARVASNSANPIAQLSGGSMDQAKIDALRDRWDKAMHPKDAALREAAETQYEVINDLRREQQKLIDQADRIQRVIDELNQQYQDLTTPHPKPATQATDFGG